MRRGEIGRMKHPILNDRSAGILLPIFSLPSKEGMGDFLSCIKYLSFLERAGLKYWQILPLNATDKYGSPYASFAMDSMNLDFLNTSLLREEGLLDKVYIGNNILEKRNFLKENILFQKVKEKESFQLFKDMNIGWLHDIILFRIIMEKENSEDIHDWDKDLLHRKPRTILSIQRDYKDEIDKYYVMEFLAHEQWSFVRKIAKEKGIKIIGDLPFYPGASSVEVWANPNYFLLDKDKKARLVSGVPGDQFDPDGQVWNSPIYNWEILKKYKYRFHLDKLKRSLNRYDFLRLDHFRGYEKFFSIPTGQEANTGSWNTGPGLEFFSEMDTCMDRLLAEDLGCLDDDFYAFKKSTKLPGMGLLPFEEPGYINKEDRIYYTGNHDTKPLGDYVNSLTLAEKIKWEYFLQRPILKDTLLYYALSRREELCIFQHTDLLDGENLRINTPGTTLGNWKMQIKEEDVSMELADKIKDYLYEVNRYYE